MQPVAMGSVVPMCAEKPEGLQQKVERKLD
jgi:hypothetical protein